MRLVRSLASLLGRVFQRLAGLLLAWSRGSASEPDLENWSAAPGDGPPEHWLRYVRARAPWLVRGNHAGPSPWPGGASNGYPAEEARASQPERTASSNGPMQMSVAASAPPAAEAHRPYTVRGAKRTGQPPALPAPETRPAAHAAVLYQELHPTAPPPSQAVSAPTARHEATPESTTGSGSAERSSTRPTRAVTPNSSIPRYVTPWRSRPTTPPPRVEHASGADFWPRLLHQDPPEPAPRVSRNAPGAVIQDSEQEQARSTGEASIPELPESSRAIPPEDRPAGEPDAERWPTLPDMGWREASWEVPSTQSLVREQLHQARLRAEQAGSSWRGPRS